MVRPPEKSALVSFMDDDALNAVSELLQGLSVEDAASEEDRAFVSMMETAMLRSLLPKGAEAMLVGYLAALPPGLLAALGDAVLEGKVEFTW